MPIPKKMSASAELRERAADMMQLDGDHIFVFPRRNGKLILYVWTSGLSESEIEKLKSHREEVKELARSFDSKIAMSSTHPEQAERREQKRRSHRNSRYRERARRKEREKNQKVSWAGTDFPRLDGEKRR